MYLSFRNALFLMEFYTFIMLFQLIKNTKLSITFLRYVSVSLILKLSPNADN